MSKTTEAKKSVVEVTKGLEIIAVPKWEKDKKDDVLVLRPEVDENLFVTYMSEHHGLDEKTLKAFEKGANEYLKRVAATAALKGADELKNDDSIRAVELRMPFGTKKSDVARALAVREVTVRNVQTGEEMKRPAVKLAVKTSFTKVSTGHIGKCREYLEEHLKG